MRYRHYKGGIYELVCEAVLEADHTPVIVYRGQEYDLGSSQGSVFRDGGAGGR